MAFEKLLASMKQLDEGLAALATNVGSANATMGPQIDELTNKADQLHHRVVGMEEDLPKARQSVDVLDGLLTQSLATQNDFSSQLELDMQQVRLGSIDIRDFIQQWGDAVIATSEGLRTIREQFSGADLGQYRQEIQELISAISDGGAQLADVLDFLKEKVPDLGKGLINVLELFKQGKATLEDVQGVIEAMKEAFPGIEANALADAIQQALAGGTLG